MSREGILPAPSQVVKDITADMTDDELMAAYGLSPEELVQIFEQLVKEGFLTRYDLGHRKSADIVVEAKPRSKSIVGIVFATLIFCGGLAWFLLGIYSQRFEHLGSVPYFIASGLVLSAILILLRSLLPGRTVWRWTVTVIAALLLGSVIQSIPEASRPQGSQQAVWIPIVVGLILLYFGLRTEMPVLTKQELSGSRCPYCNGEIPLETPRCNHCKRFL